MIRVRLFVDPQNAPEGHKDEGVCQDLNYVIGLCRQIKKAGMQVMLDFHYSDTWADPGKQFTPKRWEGCDAQAMTDSVYTYTRASLMAMKSFFSRLKYLSFFPMSPITLTKAAYTHPLPRLQ